MLQRQLAGLTQTHNGCRVFRAGTPTALLMATAQQRPETATAPQIKHADTLGRMQLVARKRQEINGHARQIDRLLAGGLRARAETNDAAVIGALVQGGTVVASPQGFDVESGGVVYHAAAAPHGYDLIGPKGSARLIRTRDGFDVVPATTNRLRKGVETVATDREIHAHARGRTAARREALRR